MKLFHVDSFVELDNDTMIPAPGSSDVWTCREHIKALMHSLKLILIKETTKMQRFLDNTINHCAQKKL